MLYEVITNTYSTPQATSDVVVSANTTVTVTLSNIAVLKSITVEANATLVIDGGGYLVVGGVGWGRKLEVNGTLTLQSYNFV